MCQGLTTGLLSGMDYPELFTDAGPRIAFFGRLQKIFNTLMVKDFCYEVTALFVPGLDTCLFRI